MLSDPEFSGSPRGALTSQAVHDVMSGLFTITSFNSLDDA